MVLELASCRECGEVKPCIPFGGFRDGKPTVSFYCPECDEDLEEWLDGELQSYCDWMEDVGRSLMVGKKG